MQVLAYVASNLQFMRTSADSPAMRAAIYARISQDREGAGVKVEAQIADCTAWSAARGYAELAVFSDNDTSAYRGRVRRGFKALCEAIEARQVDAVVVTHLDRLFRSNLELEHFITLIQGAGCKVFSIQGAGYDLSTSDGQFMARIVGAAARKESDDKSRRIRAKQVRLAEEGKYHGGGRRSFGFEADQVTVRPAEAELIREAARRVLQGESTWSILRDWTARGIATSTGSPWNSRSLNQLLTSARVAGKRSHHGVVVADAEWGAILDEETWLGVRAVLTGRTEPSGRRPTYLLSGLVYCPCGSKMRSQAIRSKRRYTCVSGPSGGCGKVSRSAEPLEAFATKWVIAVAGYEDAPAANPADIAPDVAGIEARLDRLAEEYDDDEMTKDEYKHRRARLETKLAAARDEAAKAATSSGGWRTVGIRGWWDTASDEQKRDAVRDYVSGVVVQPVGRGYRGDTNWTNTDITWTEKGKALWALLEDAAEAS